MDLHTFFPWEFCKSGGSSESWLSLKTLPELGLRGGRPLVSSLNHLDGAVTKPREAIGRIYRTYSTKEGLTFYYPGLRTRTESLKGNVASRAHRLL